MTTPLLARPDDGYADDAEFLDNVLCAECDEGREEAKTCEACGEVGCCTVSEFSCDGGYDASAVLCDDCRPSHSGCPACDPPDRDYDD